MKIIKGVQECRSQLQECEQMIFTSIIHQLTRIGHPVDIREFDFNPFGDQVSPYIEGFSLRHYDSQNGPIVQISIADADSKDLIDFISDGEMSHNDIILLLELLTRIFDAGGHKGSYLIPLEDKYISFEAHDRDCWICTCGNTPDGDGFYTCDRNGNLIEATTDSGWDELYRCERCGRVIEARDHRVLGINLNPQSEVED